jgi:hypothetical protein
MGRVFLFNDTNAPKLMGGKLVPPGEGREVDEVHMPPGEGADALGELLAGGQEDDAEAAAREAAAQRLKNLQDLLANPLTQILPGLAEHSDETLAELAAIEGEHDTPRKTLLDAIAGLQLKRAQEKAGGEPT